MLFLYLAVLIPATYWILKTLWPEMVKSPDAGELSMSIPVPPSEVTSYGFPFSENDRKMEKLELFLAEKSKTINLLETEIRIFQVQTRGFEKIKAALEDEIRHLREQNRMFRSELGIPTTVPKSGSVT